MNSNLIAPLISLCGIAVSALVSWLVAKETSKTEIEKLRITWRHDEDLANRQEFAEMAEAVGRCAQSGLIHDQTEAAAKVAAIRVKEPPEVDFYLNELQRLIQNGASGKDISEKLSTVINCKQKYIKE